ncbi:hypothetical protein D3C75_1315090 [compost metagenome]
MPFNPIHNLFGITQIAPLFRMERCIAAGSEDAQQLEQQHGKLFGIFLCSLLQTGVVAVIDPFQL